MLIVIINTLTYAQEEWLNTMYPSSVSGNSPRKKILLIALVFVLGIIIFTIFSIVNKPPNTSNSKEFNTYRGTEFSIAYPSSFSVTLVRNNVTIVPGSGSSDQMQQMTITKYYSDSVGASDLASIEKLSTKNLKGETIATAKKTKIQGNEGLIVSSSDRSARKTKKLFLKTDDDTWLIEIAYKDVGSELSKNSTAIFNSFKPVGVARE